MLLINSLNRPMQSSGWKTKSMYFSYEEIHAVFSKDSSGSVRFGPFTRCCWTA